MTSSRILIVEDDRIVARNIRKQLSRTGHTVVGITPRGEGAVQLSLQRQPNLVLMEVRLEGDTDSIDAAQHIRERLGIPLVYLIAYADDQTLRKAGITEPFSYLLKPVKSSQLRIAIEIALYKHAAERKLRDSERRYAVTLSSIGDAVITTDEKLLVTFMNPVAEALTGWIRTEAIGQPLGEVFRIINEDSRQTIDNPASKVLRLGLVAGLANHTMLLLARDGREIPIDDCGSPIIDDRGEVTGTVLVFRDVTQRRETEATLRRAQAELGPVAQRTVGELAAMIVHEVSQPLTGIMTNARRSRLLLEANTPDVEAALSTARHIVRDAQRLADVIIRVRRLFTKKSGPN